MLVHLRRSSGRVFQDAAALHHCRGEMLRFLGRHSLEENGHRPGAHLIVSDRARGEPGDEKVDFFPGQLVTVALFLDEGGDMHRPSTANSMPSFSPLPPKNCSARETILRPAS